MKSTPVVTVGIDKDFAPMEYLNTDGRYIGVTADFLKLIGAGTGLKFKIEATHTWEESISRVKTGEIHMLGLQSLLPSANSSWILPTPMPVFRGSSL